MLIGNSSGFSEKGDNGDDNEETIAEEVLKKSGIGTSLPDQLNRPVWFLDFPKWQETKGGYRFDEFLPIICS